MFFSLLDLLGEPEFRERIFFIAFRDVAEKHLLPRGISPESIRIVSDVPWLGRFERFHGLFSSWRYRHAIREAALVFYPEPRGVTRLPVSQTVLWYDFLQVAPEWKPWKKPTRYIYTRFCYGLAMRRAAGITISEHTKKEAIRLFPRTAPENLTPLWLGVRRRVAPRNSPRTGSLQLPLRCLYAGSLEARKNVFAMLASLGDIFGDLPFHLDLAGKISAEDKTRVQEALAASGHASRVTVHGLVSDEELLALAENCDATLFPSLGEGFGLPVAEAMMHGHVVMAFRNTSIPEVGGEAIVLAEDGDFAAWGRALHRLVENPADCARLRGQAIERAKLFSEEAMRHRYREYFRTILAREET